MKKILFFSTTVLFVSSFIIILDFILSNTLLNSKSCYIYEKYYYELKKNCRGKEKFKKSFPTINIFTDNLGLRVSKKSNPKDIRKKNILIFGDSFTYGTGLEYKESYAGLIEKELTDYNIYNFSISSYSPSVYLYKLNEAIKLDIKPKKIIIFLDLSDVLDEANRWIYDSTKHKVETKKSEENSHFKNNRFKQKNFILLNEFASILNFNLRIIKSKLNNSFNKNQKAEKIMTTFQASFTYKEINDLNKNYWKEKDLKAGLKKIELIFKRIENLSIKHDSELYLVIYPWAETLRFGQKAFNWSKFASKLCKEETCKLIDAIPEFEKYKKKDINWNNKLYFLNDVNFNKDGSKLLYQTIIEKISR